MKDKIRIRVAVIVQKDHKVLLVQHSKNDKKYWLLPGGGLEYGETIEQCAIRELKEETNLDVEPGEFIFMNESIPKEKYRHVVNLYYSGKVVGGSLMLGEDQVLEDVRFVDISKIPDLLFYPNVKQELLEYLENPNQTRKQSLGNRWE